ncbi:MAG: hypothetical protein ACXW11_02425 [Methylotenera sp.]
MRCKQKRKFKVPTDSSHHLPGALNVPKRGTQACIHRLRSKQSMGTHITYIHTD